MRDSPFSCVSRNPGFRPVVLGFAIWLCCSGAVGQDRPTQITVHWDKVIRTTQTTPTLQVVVNPFASRFLRLPKKEYALLSLRSLRS